MTVSEPGTLDSYTQLHLLLCSLRDIPAQQRVHL